MALTATEEALLRDLLEKQAELIALAKSRGYKFPESWSDGVLERRKAGKAKHEVTMHDIRRAVSGDITLASAVKDGSSLVFWFYIQYGDNWIEFDIREIAQKAGVQLPAFAVTGNEFESIIQADLQLAADWCNDINVMQYLEVK